MAPFAFFISHRRDDRLREDRLSGLVVGDLRQSKDSEHETEGILGKSHKTVSFFFPSSEAGASAKVDRMPTRQADRPLSVQPSETQQSLPHGAAPRSDEGALCRALSAEPGPRQILSRSCSWGSPPDTQCQRPFQQRPVWVSHQTSHEKQAGFSYSCPPPDSGEIFHLRSA